MERINTFNREVIDHAIEKGIKYLSSLNVNGRWKGFATLAGESDIWVTGFLLAHICELPVQRDIIKASQNFLLQSRHSSGGWSYSAIVPPDADSTAWCLMALHSCGELKGPSLEKARAFLWSHYTAPGVSTYKDDSGIREFISVPDKEAIAGWTSPHPDVSIAAVLADLQSHKVPGIVTWLTGLQSNTGFIHSYWWRSPQYATTLLLRAFARSKRRLPAEFVNRITKVLVQEQLPGGGYSLDSSTQPDAFTTALALESFVHLNYPGQQEERTLCGMVLLHSQQENGGWAGDFILRIPAPHVIDPDDVTLWNNSNGGGNSFIEDRQGIFATAMACYALERWRMAETQNGLQTNTEYYF